MTKEKNRNLSKMMKELEEISRFFENTNIDIDEGIKKYEEGVALAQEIKKQLSSYELKIKEIKKKYELGEEDPEVEEDGQEREEDPFFV